MESRIRAFDAVYRECLLMRLFAVGPDQDDDYRAMLAHVHIPPPSPLVRQTNRHHLLPAEKLEQWWAATTEERDRIMAEYEAGEAWPAVAYQDDPEDEERNAGVLYFEDFDEVAAIFLE
jgi:predicted oxidoreductase (fatty acid repression mutant protein)